mmetsp:Transcript_42257/g.78252  ORF Transcript_42257/g.78252 Transcript_42257/m.78252 type:complete len:215 (-) Transcript_42257:4491-5135(-)
MVDLSLEVSQMMNAATRKVSRAKCDGSSLRTGAVPTSAVKASQRRHACLSFFSVPGRTAESTACATPWRRLMSMLGSSGRSACSERSWSTRDIRGVRRTDSGCSMAPEMVWICEGGGGRNENALGSSSSTSSSTPAGEPRQAGGGAGGVDGPAEAVQSLAELELAVLAHGLCTGVACPPASMLGVEVGATGLSTPLALAGACSAAHGLWIGQAG